jgi:chromosome segregation protein
MLRGTTVKIKRLEIAGFKSFADKVVLDFQQGVTGVVGPNGCGKSNIVDAIRWCMGEQSAKNLRGKAMEDVIFAGSDNRKSQGMAEVSLVFSIEDGRAPAKYLEFNEIQLTRRLFRDGESDYLINKTPCRLLDITELFMDTGVGTKAYSIIEQGKIGQVLHSRPEERRLLIEEAAGVTKFKARKQLALKKIEGTRQNLARLNDLLGEIKRQLNGLQRQAKKAEKFRELREEQREIDLLFAVHTAASLQQERSEAEAALSALNERMRQQFGAVGSVDAQVEQSRLAVLEFEQQLATAQEQSYRARSEAAAVENSLVFRRKEFEGLAERLTRFEGELTTLHRRRDEQLAQQARLQEQQQSLTAELTSAEALVSSTQQTQIELEQSFESANRNQEEQRREFFVAQAAASQNRNRIENATARLAVLAERVERQNREQQLLTSRIEEGVMRRAALETALQQKTSEREQAEQELSRLAGEEQRLASQLPEAEQAWQVARDDLSRVASRLKSLLELEAQFAGYGQGVQSLLKDSALRTRLGGLLADRLEVEEAYEAAVEAVLADRLQVILCEQDDDLLAGLEFLRQQGTGRAQLAVPVAGVTYPAMIAGAEPLSTRLKADDSVRGLVSRLLAATYLASDLATALTLSRRHPALQFVTRAGELASVGGLVAGGSSEAVASGIIHKKREIKTLDGQVRGLEQQVAALQQERDRQKLMQQTVARDLLAARSGLHRLELEQAGLQKDLQQVELEANRVAERIKLHNLERGNLDEELSALEAERSEATAGLAAAEEQTRGLEQTCTELATELEGRRTALANGREQLTALRIAAATLKEQGESVQRGMTMGETQLADLASRLHQIELELQQCIALREQLAGQIVADEQHLKVSLAAQLELDAHMKTVREGHEQASAQLAAVEADARIRREEHDAIRQQQADLNLRFSSLTLQLEHLEQSIQDRHRCLLLEAQQQMADRELDEPAARSRQLELERQLGELGEVNLMAIEEYADMEQRYTFLSFQKVDLEESLHDLQQAIQKINRTTRQRFLETFNQVNEKFREVFPRLFCGGKAELKLTDEQDLLETGIDILVQPPGKRVANVMLMSGGEKALTAVALIFSIFLIKPTPFCLLDEVDAPLDDANIGRFNEMVREMSSISQFIIITHNKATMGVADTLYGVTMEEPGASKIVSVRLQ